MNLLCVRYSEANNGGQLEARNDATTGWPRWASRCGRAKNRTERGVYLYEYFFFKKNFAQKHGTTLRTQGFELKRVSRVVVKCHIFVRVFSVLLILLF